MTPPNEQFIQLVTVICAQFNREPTEALILSYWMGLDDLPIRETAQAVRLAMRECDFMPSVKQIRDRVLGKPEDLAELAFATLSRHVDSYASIDFEDRRINATVRHCGGMTRIGNMTKTEFDTWFRKEFLKTYAMFQRRGVGDEQGQHLVGTYEAHNGRSDRSEAVQVAASYPIGNLSPPVEERRLIS